MYSKRTRSGYQTQVRRKRLISFAVLLAAAGAITAASFHFAGNFRGGVKSERRELLRLWDEGSFSEVFKQTKDSLIQHPTDYFLLTMNGFSAYQLGISQINSLNAAGYFDECVWALRKAMLLKNASNDGRLYYVLGKAYSYKGESFADLAVKYLEKARELSYNAADIPEYLGLAYASIGDYRSSVTAFAEALQPREGFDSQQGENGSSGLLLLSIARSYLALGEYESARAYLMRCVDISPDSRTILTARLLLSEVLKETGDIEGAKKQLQEILGESDDNAEAHYQLGELYALQGDTTRARAEWRLAIRADPAHAKARARLSM